MFSPTSLRAADARPAIATPTQLTRLCAAAACGNTCPYGQFDWVNIYATSGWTSSSDPDYDYALIELESTPGYGWMSMGYDAAMNTAWSFNVRG